MIDAKGAQDQAEAEDMQPTRAAQGVNMEQSRQMNSQPLAQQGKGDDKRKQQQASAPLSSQQAGDGSSQQQMNGPTFTDWASI